MSAWSEVTDPHRRVSIFGREDPPPLPPQPVQAYRIWDREQQLLDGHLPGYEELSEAELQRFFRRYRGLLISRQRDQAYWGTTNKNLRRAYARLDQNEAALARAQRIAQLGNWERALTTRSCFVSTELLRIFGIEGREFDATPRAFARVVHPDDRPALGHCLEQAARTGHSFDFEHRVVWPDGTVRMVRHQGGSLLDLTGRPERVFGTLQDVTEWTAAQEQLRLSSSLFDSIGEVIAIADARRRIVEVNPAFVQVTGYAAEEALGEELGFNHRRRADGRLDPAPWSAVDKNDRWQGECWAQRKNGEDYPEWYSLTAVRNGRGVVTHYIGLSTDIGPLKRSQAQLEYLAHYDAVTGLANRRLLCDRLQFALAQARRTGRQVGVLFLDLDGFKLINDTLGHDAGDQVLAIVARRLKCHARESDTVARLGGDEFVIALTNLACPEEATRLARAVIDDVAQPIAVNQSEVLLTFSIGVAIGPEDGHDSATLLSCADRAMYWVKQRGKNAYRLFSRQLENSPGDSSEMAALLSRGLDAGDLFLEFQPQVAVQSGAVVGLEALVRWRCGGREVVPPSDFIPVAERTGLIGRLGEWVLDEACRCARDWQQRSCPPVRIAINLSAQQLRQETLVDMVRRVAAGHDVDLHQLELELTESMLFGCDELTVRSLRQLGELGVQLAIDDFGAGHSSLRYLQQFPIARLKMDKAFLDRVPGPEPEARLVVAMIKLAQSLELEVVAEGIERQAQLDFLRASGCQVVQGFLLSPPVGAAQIPELLLGNAPWLRSGLFAR